VPPELIATMKPISPPPIAPAARIRRPPMKAPAIPPAPEYRRDRTVRFGPDAAYDSVTQTGVLRPSWNSSSRKTIRTRPALDGVAFEIVSIRPCSRLPDAATCTPPTASGLVSSARTSAPTAEVLVLTEDSNRASSLVPALTGVLCGNKRIKYNGIRYIGACQCYCRKQASARLHGSMLV
jgi:hypothetical protein